MDVSAVPERPAGAGRYTVDLVRALAPRDDVELTLIARIGDASRWAQWAPAARLLTLVPRRRPARLVWEQASMPALLTREGVDVHHGPHYTMPERARLARVVTIHDMTFFDHPEWHEAPKVPVFRRAIRAAARRADVLVCVSATTASRLRQLVDVRGEVRVVPHGVDHDRFRPEEPRPGSDLAQLSAFGISPPYVAFVGTAEPRKGVTTLIRAFDRMSPGHPGITLVLAGGEGWGSRPLRTALATMRNIDRVRRTGYLPDEVLPPLLRQAAAVAYPSLEEGFGLPALEALACGAPLVTTSGTAMEEIAAGSALLVEPGDADGLAGALDMLVRGDAGLEARRARGLATAARYTWAATAEGHVAAYLAARDAYRAAGPGEGTRPAR